MAYFAIHIARVITRLARVEVQVDLFDLRPLGAFGRVSLRLSAVWILGISILILGGLVDPNPQDVAPALPAILAVIGIAMLFAVLALVVPVRGVQQRIRSAKHAELGRLNAQLRSIRELERSGDETTPGRVSDLVAMRGYVDALREWPFDASMLGRFGLYLLIPLGSWLGGAFVERLVDSVLE